ncbi:MAG: peptidylprolyl isomerase [bacterium]
MNGSHSRDALRAAVAASALALALAAGACANDSKPAKETSAASHSDASSATSAKTGRQPKDGELSAAAPKDGAVATPAADAASKEAAVKKDAPAAKTANGYIEGVMPVKPATLPEHVQVQHILIGFAGSVPGKNITRTKDEAQKLAMDVLERARKGEDYGKLVREYTDDSPPGIYAMAGIGVTPAPGEFARDRMVAAFGDVGFNISPGNIDVAAWDAQKSPFGWHIIKRIK